ncbi:MAG: arginine--tRNA ligase, partial [Bacteroidota bacterium]
MNPEISLKEHIAKALHSLYQIEANPSSVIIQKTRPEFEGEFTLVVFPYIKISKKSPEETGKEIGNFLLQHSDFFKDFNVIKGFLNISLKHEIWLTYFSELLENKISSNLLSEQDRKSILIEYPSPNTNKPLHL